MRSGETVLGGVAQLGERLPCTQEVVGSIPITSTIYMVVRIIRRLGRKNRICPTLDFWKCPYTELSFCLLGNLFFDN